MNLTLDCVPHQSSTTGKVILRSLSPSALKQSLNDKICAPGYKRFLTLLSTALLMVSCAVEAQPIQFGKDQCRFCRMTIVDRQHAAQAVTKKGKQRPFDSIECLVNDIVKSDSESELSLIRVCHYGQSRMIPAQAATYLISEKIKSPMGANLSAFESADQAREAQKMHGGELFSWPALVKRFAQ